MILDLPRLKVWVNLRYVSNDCGYGAAYLFSITLIESRPLLFTVHFDDGAVYSRLPIEAIKYDIPKKNEPKGKPLDPWGAISDHGQVIEHAYLKDYRVKTANGFGRYYCTIDYFYGGFAQDPEQHKTSNLIILDSGHLTALPNNFCLFLDSHFTDNQAKTRSYRRNSLYFV